nr:GNAT family N-acetyltransferase [Microbacterium flavescens]
MVAAASPSPAPVVVRRASRLDVAGLASLKAEWAQRAEAPTDAEIDAFATVLGDWMERHADGLVPMAAVAGDEIVGMGWMVVFERVPNLDDPRRLTADIQSVYVRPAYRGRGIAAEIVDELCREADRRGVPRAIVSSSSRAISLYARAGFTASPLLLERTKQGDPGNPRTA